MSDPTVHDVEGGEGSQATVRETNLAGTVREVSLTGTVREGSSAATVREESGSGNRSGGGGGSSLMRLPDSLAARYLIERELPTRGTEADLFVVHPVDEGAPVVVKLYRANIHPKEEVQARVAALDGRHVIRQIECGVSEGRSYEVIEYATAGSLADLMRDERFDGALLREMTGQVAAGLGYLHGLDPSIVHRDVKPDNVLVRGRSPLDLVLTDFGLASVLDNGSWRASTADRTIKYAAPEASAGQVSREMDWWSLGMMAAEAAGGRHPFAGVSEQTVAIHYSNRLPVPLDAIPDERTRLLCLGLLSYDRKQRWGAAEVERWLGGDESLRPPVVETQQRAAAVPFKFAGGEYGTTKELAAALASNWTAAQRTVARADGLLSWLKDEAKEYEAWQWLSEIAQDKAQLDAGLKVTLLLPMLDPALPPMFEGEPLTRERLLAEVSAAATGADSVRTARLTQLWEHLPALAELSPEAAWLGEAHASLARARTEADELAKDLGVEEPQVATGSWDFTRQVLTFLGEPKHLAATRERFDALLVRIPASEAGWAMPLKVIQSLPVGVLILAIDLEQRLVALAEEIEREMVNRSKVAAILRLQDDLCEAGWSVTPQAGHTKSVSSVAVTPNGRHLVTVGGIEKTARLWDLATGRELRAFTGHTLWVDSVAVTPDGRHLVTGSSDKTARLWDFATGRELRAFIGHTSAVTSVAVTPDGRHLVTGNGDKTARLWDLATGQELRAFTGHADWVTSVAVTPDRRLLTGSQDNTARLWDIATGQELRAFTGHTGLVSSVAVTPDGRHLVTGSGDETARLWDIATGHELCAFTGHTGSVSSVAVTTDGRHLVTGSSDNTARLWELATGRELRAFTGHTGSIDSVAVTPDGRYLVMAGGRDAAARLWDLATGEALRAFTGHTAPVYSVAITPEGRHLVTGGDSTARLWDLATGRELSALFGLTGSIYSVATTLDGRRLVTGSEDNTARLWGLTTGRQLRAFTGHTASVTSLALTPDGRHLVTGSGDKTARLWNLSTGRELRAFGGHTYSVLSVAVTPDGQHLVTGSSDNTARLWDLATGRELRTFFGHTKSVSSVAVMPDGRYLVTGSLDNTARLWDLATGHKLCVFTGHTDRVSSVAVTPDGRHLVTGSTDCTVRLWDIATGQELCAFTGHTAPVYSVTITPDGRHLVTVSWDNTTRQWDLATGQQLRVYVLMGSGYSLSLGSEGQLDALKGDPNALILFVRGVEALTVTEILNDRDETWRRPQPPKLCQTAAPLKPLPTLEPKPRDITEPETLPLLDPDPRDNAEPSMPPRDLAPPQTTEPSTVPPPDPEPLYIAEPDTQQPCQAPPRAARSDISPKLDPSRRSAIHWTSAVTGVIRRLLK